ncbi:restriction endonuclease subunit S [Burkholderia arboris]|uniref:restriction endonuclease subunit S n=1 Tax=Burkholderia arboris TaxID=488730 RepID=UPI001CF2CBB5|nr:restriction endonuclease subunit S [Burkholderia arboris]MCA8493565.1 restriction endonuclease subunit S [Burkholderia arboris]
MNYEKLGDLVEIKHGFAFSSQYFQADGPYVLLTPGNFYEEGGFKLRAEQKHYDGPVPAAFVLKPGDLLVAMTEQGEGLLGSTAFVPDGKPCLHNQRLGLVTSKPGAAVNLRYIYYVLNWRDVRQQIRATSSGAKIRHTSPSRIYAVDIPKPPIEIQRRIAGILGAYDDLIEVNRRRIAVLEEMARGLFTEWFIRLRFPGHEDVAIEETPDGPLPAGWSWGRFADLALEVRDTVSPEAVDPAMPYIGLEHISRRSTTLAEHGAAADVSSLKARFRRGDILFGKIRPYFHKVAWAPFDGVASTDAIVWRPTPGLAAQALLQASDDAFVAHSVQTSNGTKMPRANNRVLADYRCALAPSNISERFEKAALPMIKSAAALQASNANLAAARDLLLPRLISGQLSVTQAEQELKAA